VVGEREQFHARGGRARDHGGRLERPVGSRRMCLKVELGRRHLYDLNAYFTRGGVFAP
jgi:hypothetical protein